MDGDAARSCITSEPMQGKWILKDSTAAFFPFNLSPSFLQIQNTYEFSSPLFNIPAKLTYLKIFFWLKVLRVHNGNCETVLTVSLPFKTIWSVKEKGCVFMYMFMYYVLLCITYIHIFNVYLCTHFFNSFQFNVHISFHLLIVLGKNSYRHFYPYIFRI